MTLDLLARFDAADGKEEEVASLIHSYAAVVRREPGAIRFEPYRSGEDGRRFVVIERYEDENAFRNHLSSPANAAFNARLAPLVEGEAATLEFLDMVTDGGNALTLPPAKE